MMVLGVSALHAGKGKLRVASDQQGAYVYVNGKKKAMTGEGFSSILLEEGEYTIKVVKPIDEYFEYTQSKQVFVGEDTSVKLTFQLVKLKSKDISMFNDFTIKCNENNYKSCSALGYMYMSQIGVKKNIKLALKLYEKACTGSYYDACIRLGTVYLNGEVVKQNYKQALKLYEKACELKDRGCSDLAYMYYQGLGVKKNENKARILYTKACENGNGDGLSCYMIEKGGLGN